MLLIAIITPDGRATDIHVAKGLGLGLDEKAIEAVRTGASSRRSVRMASPRRCGRPSKLPSTSTDPSRSRSRQSPSAAEVPDSGVALTIRTNDRIDGPPARCCFCYDERHEELPCRLRSARAVTCVAAAAPRAAAQDGSIEFVARATPSGGLEEPVRGFPFYLFRARASRTSSEEVDASYPKPDMDAFIDTLGRLEGIEGLDEEESLGHALGRRFHPQVAQRPT